MEGAPEMSDHGFIWRFISGFFRFFSIFLFFVIVPLDSLSSTESEMMYLDSLAKRLVKDGFDEKQIQELFRRPEVRFDTRGVSMFSVHQEAKLNYGQFLSGSNIQKARQYMEQHLSSLQSAERVYGVEKEVITAIMLVETRLGTYLGGSSILNTLSTMAALSAPETRVFGGVAGRTPIQSFALRPADTNGRARRPASTARIRPGPQNR